MRQKIEAQHSLNASEKEQVNGQRRAPGRGAPSRIILARRRSKFLNRHLVRYCRRRKIQFTRGRPYKKNDNARIEQKNWTHVRKLIGWDRFDTPEAVDALNGLYRRELRLMMNLFQPSVKLVRKERIGSRLKRAYDSPKTPHDRLRASPHVDRETIQALVRLREATDPFRLATTIEQKLDRIAALGSTP